MIDYDPLVGILEGVEALRMAVRMNEDPSQGEALQTVFDARLRSIVTSARYAGGPCSCSAGVPCQSTDTALELVNSAVHAWLFEVMFVSTNLLAQLVQATQQDAEMFLRSVEDGARFTAITRPEEG